MSESILIVGAGPSFNPEHVQQFNGKIIACDVMVPTLNTIRKPDYVTVLEDSQRIRDFVYHIDPKTITELICSHRGYHTALQRWWLNQIINDDKVHWDNWLWDTATHNVGMYSICKAVDYLGYKHIDMTGVDFMWYYSTSNPRQRAEWEEFWEIKQCYMDPKGVKLYWNGHEITEFKYIDYTLSDMVQVAKNRLKQRGSPGLVQPFPGFDNFTNYKTWRHARNSAMSDVHYAIRQYGDVETYYHPYSDKIIWPKPWKAYAKVS